MVFPQSFADGGRIVTQLESPTLHPTLLKKLQAMLDKTAAKNPPAAQAVAVIDALDNIVQTNKLLYAWDDVRQVKALMAGGEGSVKVSETGGTVKVVAVNGAYNFTFTVSVSDDYPVDGLTISAGRSNYHERLVRTHVAQANEIVRRCTLGYPVDLAVNASNPIKAPASIAKVDALKDIRITADHMLDLKHDVAFLKQASELRDFDQKKKKGTNQYAASAKDRKNARRTLKKMTATETAAEAKRLEEMETRAKLEAEALTGRPSDTATPSLFAVVRFLVQSFVGRLSTTNCTLCAAPLLPSDPAKAFRYIEKDETPRSPVRVYCGHWYHFGCLDTALTTPPFERYCEDSGCGKRIYHPKWPSDVKKLEKQWARQEAHKRELAEIADFLDIGDL